MLNDNLVLVYSVSSDCSNAVNDPELLYDAFTKSRTVVTNNYICVTKFRSIVNMCKLKNCSVKHYDKSYMLDTYGRYDKFPYFETQSDMYLLSLL